MKIGIVGTGAMAQRFLTAVDGKVADLEFMMAYSPDEKSREIFAQKYPRIVCTGDYSVMLTNPDVHAVYIATPVDTHAELTLEAANHGKHILCEKPMAITLQECESMVAASRDNRVILQIAYMMRYHPAHQYIREQISSGALGDIKFIHLERTSFADFKSPDFPPDRKWFVSQTRSGGGVFMDLGSHLLDLLIYLMGDDIETFDLAGEIDEELGIELSGLANLKFNGGALATIYVSWDVPLDDNLIQVYGDKASIQAIRTIGPYTDWRIELVEDSQRQTINIPHQNHYIREIEHFIQCANTGTQPLTSGVNSIKTERLRLKLYERFR